MRLVGWFGFAAFASSFMVMISDFISPEPLSSRSVATLAESVCRVGAVHASLRTWVDVEPESPALVLPPGSIRPPKIQLPSTSHVLNVELKISNPTEHAQDVRVAQVLWGQAGHKALFDWQRQPTMSPWNRYDTIQRLPLDLLPGPRVQVEIQLMINGKPCSLVETTEVAQH